MALRSTMSSTTVSVGVSMCVLVTAVIIAMLGWHSAGDGPRFEATSVVGPVEFQINPVWIPRTVSALSREPANSAERHGNSSVMTPLQGTRLTLVSARSHDPETAAAIANSEAISLISDLNRPGPGLGTFAVLTQATSPRHRSSPSATAALSMGLLAGMSLAAAVIGVRAWWAVETGAS